MVGGGGPRVEGANQNGEDLYTVREDCTLLAVCVCVCVCVSQFFPQSKKTLAGSLNDGALTTLEGLWFLWKTREH